jgi:hypothetical protein
VNRKHLWSFALHAFALLALALLMTAQVKAQVISGDLVGTVLDKTGAGVPKAIVEAVNVETGIKYSTEGNEVGEYRFNNLPVGTYNISASAPNFSTTNFSGFKIELNKTVTLPITLDVKGVTNTVEVSGVAPALDTSTAQLSNTFDERQVADLPSASSGSGVLNLSLLGSGVASSGGVGVGTGPSVGGQRPRNNDFTIEGVDNNNKGVTGPLVVVPNDAVAEFSFLENQFSPEFGHSSGGQFNTIVKSGTNSYHGLAYVYNQNRNYNALDTLQRLEGFTSQPRFDSNRFGGQFGGPILKNKLFFFANYEYDPLGQAGGAGHVCSPTAAGFATINGTAGLSATNVAQFEKYVAAGTLTNVGCAPIPWVGDSNCTANPAGCIPTAGLAVVAPSYTNIKNLVTSMDYDLSTKDQIRGRYIYNSVAGISTAAQLPFFFTPLPQKFHLVALNEYHTFTPTLTNEFRVGFNRFASNTPDGNFSYPGLDSFPNLEFRDLNNLQIGPNQNAPQSTIQNTYQVAEAVTWTKGAHTMKFGADGRKLIAPETFTQRVRGDYQYTQTLFFLEDATPDALAERSNGDPVFYGDQTALFGFANDDWRIRRNLTLNLGVRYEYTTTPFTTRSQALNSAASVPGLINFIAPQPAPNNWAPRLGFAYSPGTSGRTSIRAGIGEAYDVLFDNLGLLSLPPELSSTIDCAPVGSFTCATPFLGGGGILPGPGGIRTFPTIAAQRAATSAFVPAQLKDPKSIDWTLGVQHTFGKDYTLEVRYVGTRGIHLPTQIQLNKQARVTPTFFLPTYTSNIPNQATLDASAITLGDIEATSPIVPAYATAGFNRSTITSYQPWSESTYNGLAATLNKRMSNGLQFVGSYTFSHLIDDATAEVFSTTLSPRRAQDGLNLRNDFANSILDHRHRFTLALIYDEPFFQHSNALLKNTVGNWEFAPIYTYQSGQWATAQSGLDANLNGDSAGDRTIWNASGAAGTGSGVAPLCTSAIPTADCTLTNVLCTGNPATDAHGCPGINVEAGVVGYKAVNPNARYIQAAYGALANVGRNTLELPAINDIDLTAVKRFTLTERFKIEFQAQFLNLLNHPQWVGGFLNDVKPIGYTGSQVSALQPQNVDFNRPATQFAGNARTLQLALKFFF